MSYVTNNLEGEPGIQYGGIENNTHNISNMTNMLLLVEDVPRGRLDQAMNVTSENKNQLLGRQAGNLYLRAIEDALDEDISSIQVLRVHIEHIDEIDSGILQEQSDFFVLTEDNLILGQE
ncbi:hypothetical protein [Acinetobacter colistiniresistens]|uniref:hypothetical protein n=1 Tax=Acinetobacter colistiniresistens TaxID=280145 RepID=UPI0012507215|nr:hypothetical protein [Acinetobacter colistiniresistens]